MEKISAGIVQWALQPGDVDTNLQRALEALADVSKKGADLAVMPEMWSCGFDYKRLAAHAARTPELLETLSRFARRHCILIAGSLPEADGEGIYNTLYIIDRDGRRSGHYRKVHLFSLTREPAYFVAGDRIEVFPTTVGVLGAMICYDLRFPELARTLALKGAEICIVSALWPLTRILHWDILLQARAVENQFFLVAANGCGMDNAIEYGGHSRIVSPWGDLPAALDAAPGTALADLDPVERQRFRQQIPCLKERRPEMYS